MVLYNGASTVQWLISPSHIAIIIIWSCNANPVCALPTMNGQILVAYRCKDIALVAETRNKYNTAPHLDD